MGFLFAVIANAVALWVAAALLPGIEIGGQGADFVVTLLLVAAIFGVINAFVKPILQLVTLPLIILTLGLFLIVINALLLMLTSWLSTQLGLAFDVDSFWWTAVLGAVIISAVSMVVGMLLPSGDRRR